MTRISLHKRDKKVRVAVLNSHPIQYFSPLYAYINRSSDIEIVPIYISQHGLRPARDDGFGEVFRWDVDLLSGTEPVFLPGSELRELRSSLFGMLAPQVWREITQGKYDALIVHGHRIGANHIATLAAKTIGIPVFTRSDAQLRLKKHRLRLFLRRLILGAYYTLFDGFLTAGTLNEAYYQALGVPSKKLTRLPFSIDNDSYRASSALSPVQRHKIRNDLGLVDSRPAILFASKFQARKRPGDLISAAVELERRGLEFDLVFVGSGELAEDLREGSRQLERTRVVFPGFKNQSELPAIMGACDVFVLPASSEPWGLIVNEAMCAGLPIVTTHDVGCSVDLVREGENGFLYTAGDTGGLAAALGRLVSDRCLRIRMGEHSRQIIGAWGYAECAAGLRAALQKVGVLESTAPISEHQISLPPGFAE